MAYVNKQTFSYTDSDGAVHRWSVNDIIRAVRGKTPVPVKLSTLNPDVRGVEQRRVEAADLSYPVIIDPGFGSKSNITMGFVDGVHRILKAKKLGLDTIQVIFINIDDYPEMTLRERVLARYKVR